MVLFATDDGRSRSSALSERGKSAGAPDAFVRLGRHLRRVTDLALGSVFVDTFEKVPAIVDRTVANDGIHLDTKRGAVLLQEPAPGVVVYSVAGFADVELHRMVLPDLEEAITRNRGIEFFADAGELEGYDTQFRVEWTDWFNANRGSLVDVHVFVRSSIARMGLSVANLATGGMLRPYYSSGPFDAALRKRAPAWTRVPIRAS